MCEWNFSFTTKRFCPFPEVSYPLFSFPESAVSGDFSELMFYLSKVLVKKKTIGHFLSDFLNHFDNSSRLIDEGSLNYSTRLWRKTNTGCCNGSATALHQNYWKFKFDVFLWKDCTVMFQCSFDGCGPYRRGGNWWQIHGAFLTNAEQWEGAWCHISGFSFTWAYVPHHSGDATLRTLLLRQGFRRFLHFPNSFNLPTFLYFLKNEISTFSYSSPTLLPSQIILY